MATSPLAAWTRVRAAAGEPHAGNGSIARSSGDCWSHVSTLHGHYGCVNRMAWLDDGDRLASVSDDTDLLLWRWAGEDGRPWHMSPQLRISTGHSGNVFGVAALGRPRLGDLPDFVTGGMDGEVRLHSAVGAASGGGGSPAATTGNGSARSMRRLMLDARRAMRGQQALGPPPTDAYASRLVYSHRSMVKSVQGAGDSPFVFFSAAEDGTVCQFDVRTLGAAAGLAAREPSVAARTPAAGVVAGAAHAPPTAAPTSLAGTIAALSASAAATTASAVESGSSAIVRRHTRNVLITMSTHVLRGSSTATTTTTSSSSRPSVGEGAAPRLTTVDERIWRALATRRLIRPDDGPLSNADDGSAATAADTTRRSPGFAAVTSLKHMTVSAANPNLLLTAGGDPYLRLYDRRMLPRLDAAPGADGHRGPVILASPSTLHSGYRSMHENVLRFAPLHLGASEDIAMGRGPALAMPAYPTYCEFDDGNGGDRLLGTYHGDGVYVFDCRQSDVAGGVVVDALPLGAGVARGRPAAGSTLLPASSSRAYDVASASMEGAAFRWPQRLPEARASRRSAATPSDVARDATVAALPPLVTLEACELDDLLGDGVPAPAEQCSGFVRCRPPAGEPLLPMPLRCSPSPAPAIGRTAAKSSEPVPSSTATADVAAVASVSPVRAAAAAVEAGATTDGLPPRVRALQSAGTDHFRGGGFTQAATCYSLAIELMRATLMEAGAAMMLGAPVAAGRIPSAADAPAAAAACETALALLLTNRAICLVKRAYPGDGASAVEDCYAALRLVPDRWKARMWLARALEACGRHRDALDVMLSLYRDHDPRYPHSVADALRAVGESVEPLVGPMPELEGLVPVDLEYALEGTLGWLTEQVARMRSAAAAAAAADVRRRAVDEAQQRASDEKEAEEGGGGAASTHDRPPAADSVAAAADAARSGRGRWLKKRDHSSDAVDEDEEEADADAVMHVRPAAAAAASGSQPAPAVIPQCRHAVLRHPPLCTDWRCEAGPSCQCGDSTCDAATTGAAAPAVAATGAPGDGSTESGSTSASASVPPLEPPMPLDDLLCVRHEARLACHINRQTDIKEAAFIPTQASDAWRAILRNAALAATDDSSSDDGSAGVEDGDQATRAYHSVWSAFASGRRGYVVAGSDLGKAVIYDLATGLPVTMLDADADVCNAVRPNPRLPVLATSGIEDVIRLWAPPSSTPTPPSAAPSAHRAGAAAGAAAATAPPPDRPHAAVSASSPSGCRAIEDWIARHARGDGDDDDGAGSVFTMQALLRHLARAEGGPFVLRPSQGGDDEEPPGPGDIGAGATVIPCATQ